MVKNSVYVGYPKMAQDDINDSTLDITEMKITDPKPDSLGVKITQVIGTDSSFHPLIDAFEADVSLKGSDDPFTTLSVPSIKAEDGAKSTIEQTLELKDSSDAFAEYSKAVMQKEEVELVISGKTDLQVGKLPKTGVDYDKTVKMKGTLKFSYAFDYGSETNT